MRDRLAWIGSLGWAKAAAFGLAHGFAIWLAVVAPTAPGTPPRAEIVIRGTAVAMAIAIPVIARLEAADARLEELGRAEP